MTWENLLEFILQLVIATCFFIRHKEKRRYFYPRMAAGMIAVFVLCGLNDRICGMLWEESNLFVNIYKYFFVLAAVTCLFWFSYQITLAEALFYSCSGYALQNAAHYCFIIIYTVVAPQYLQISSKTVSYVVFVAVYIAAFWATRRISMRDHAGMEQRSILRLSCLTLFFTIILSIQVPLGSKEYMLYYVYSLFGALVVLFLQYGLMEKTALLREKEIVEQMLMMESRQHKLSEETIALINLKCHDLKHQFHALCTGAQLDPGVVSDVQKTIASYDSMIETGNPALNIILTEKSMQCGQLDITFTYLLDGHWFDFMESADIYSLFGNALDNAIEGVKQEEKENRFISLKAGRQGALVTFHIENYCGEKPVFQDGLPLTTKQSEPGLHGYGVKSIRFLAEKYNGYAKMQAEDSLFLLDVMMTARPSA